MLDECANTNKEFICLCLYATHFIAVNLRDTLIGVFELLLPNIIIWNISGYNLFYYVLCTCTLCVRLSLSHMVDPYIICNVRIQQTMATESSSFFFSSWQNSLIHKTKSLSKFQWFVCLCNSSTISRMASFSVLQ